MTTLGMIPNDSLSVEVTGSSNYRSIQEKLSDVISVRDFGTYSNGVTDDAVAFQAAINARINNDQGDLYVNKGAYKIGTRLSWGQNVRLRSDANIQFASGSGTNLNLSALAPYQVGPVFSYDIGYFVRNDTEYSNVFVNATTVYQQGSSNTVAVFGEGVTQNSASCWGGNFVGCASDNGGGNAIGIEINPINPGGSSSNTYGLVIASAGSYPSRAGIQIQNNNSSSPFNNGIVFNNPAGNLIQNGSVVFVNGGSTTCGINFANTSFTYAPFLSNGFKVDPSGNVTAKSFANSSDYRLKEEIKDIKGALSQIAKLSPKTYIMKEDLDKEIRYGFLAHEAKSVFNTNSFVRGNKDDTRIAINVVLDGHGNILAENVDKNTWSQLKTGRLAIYPENSNWAENKIVPCYQTLDLSQLIPLLVASTSELLTKLNEELHKLNSRIEILENASRS